MLNTLNSYLDADLASEFRISRGEPICGLVISCYVRPIQKFSRMLLLKIYLSPTILPTLVGGRSVVTMLSCFFQECLKKDKMI